MSRFVEKAATKLQKLPVTEIKRLLEIQTSELSIRDSILNSVPEGYFLVSREGRVTYYNTALSGLMPLGRKRRAAGGVPVESFIQDSDTAAFVIDCVRRGADGEEFGFQHESSLYGKTDVRLTCIKLKNQEATLFCARDVTVLKRIREQFRKNESLAAMTTMAAGVAHEIKNPLTSISLYVQLLQRNLSTEGSITKEEAEKSLGVISEEIDRLNAIAVDFLFAVRPMKVEQELSDVNSVVRKAADVAAPEAEQQNVELVLNLATTLPKANIDRHLIEQSLLNLIRNSLQAIDPSRTDGRIGISTFLDENSIKILVSDNGCGMTEEQMSKIFEPYYTTKASGTGLGLTTIFKIMKEHGGEVTASSVYGEGSVFTLQLPVPKSERFKLEQKA